ncbi:cytochrome P450 [Abortiporus biennis]|nr:cytochrome P450 [Abortiporus biennis]
MNATTITPQFLPGLGATVLSASFTQLLLYGFLGLVSYEYLRWLILPSKSSIPDIPAVTNTAPFFATLDAFKFLKHGHSFIKQGYAKYNPKPFKVPEVFRWHVILTSPQQIEEFRRAPDSSLSFEEAILESLQIEHTLGPAIANNAYHIPIIRTKLTRNIVNFMDNVRDELSAAFEEELGVPENGEWKQLPALATIMKVVARTSNRVFVGLPICRNRDYMELNIQFTIDVIYGGMILRMLPWFLRSLAAKWLTNVPASIQRGKKHLEGMIEERYQLMESFKNIDPETWDGQKPNDMLMWLMEEAQGEEKDAEHLVGRILTINFAAIHTSSMSFTDALFHLAANPSFIKPLRDEVEQVIKDEGGWTKASVQKMRKIDSFLKECQRYGGLGALSMTRLSMKDFTFSDGTYIPKGTFISAAAGPVHKNVEYYDDPEVFNPWRFANMRDTAEEESEILESARHSLVTTSSQFLTFGHGRHACPGRFFAATELKSMLAHLVLHYDVKMEDGQEGIVPQPLEISFSRTPNRTASVLFRKRQD